MWSTRKIKSESRLGHAKMDMLLSTLSHFTQIWEAHEETT